MIDDLSSYLKHLEEQGGLKEKVILPVDALQFASDLNHREQLVIQSSASSGNKVIMLLENIESVAFDRSKRIVVLEFLESQITDHAGMSILILCDVAPLYMLTQQSQYIPERSGNEFADAQEIVRWTRLLYRFNKYYDWSPMELEFNDADAWENLVLRELSALPELYSLKPELDKLKEEGKTMECAIQYISTHAGPVYRRRWSFCTKREKLLLYQLAKGLMINPQNIEPLEHLMRRGFVRRDPNWSIVNLSFARFVLTAEAESVYNEWVTASEQGLWRILRIPLLGTVIVILGILMYSAQEATESFLALATSVVALLPLLLRNLNLDRSTPTSPAEN